MGSPAMCWLGVPLIVGDEVIGLVTVQSYRPDVVYGPADQELLSFVASQIANSLARRRSAESLRRPTSSSNTGSRSARWRCATRSSSASAMQDQLRHQVMHDALTGLPNRGYLRDRIDRVLAVIRRESAAALRAAVPGCRPLQDHQRQPRSSGRRRGAEGGGDAGSPVACGIRTWWRDWRGMNSRSCWKQVQLPADATAVAQRVMDALGAPCRSTARSCR